MAQVEFNYNGNINIIQCQEDQKMIDICNNFKSKSDINNKEIFFVYDGTVTSQFDKNLTFIQLANSFDKLRKKMNILVYDKDNVEDIKSKIQSKNVICPKCNELIIMKIENYKINLYECRNNHSINEISLNEFYKSQIIDLRNIKCKLCKEKNKSITFNNDFYKCYNCNINICPLCKTNHDKSHNTINYDKINYLCEKHNEPFTDYCKNCKNNICFLCDGEHDGHNIISLRKMMINKNEVLTKLEDLKNAIIILENNIETIIEILNYVRKTMNNYYKFEKYIINNYDKNQRNYEILYNINEFNIKNEKSIISKFNHIFNLYKDMNNNNVNNHSYSSININNNTNINISSNNFIKIKSHKLKKRIKKNEIKFTLKIGSQDVDKKIYFLSIIQMMKFI